MANLVNVPGIENVSDAFKEKVIKMAADLETDPNFLMAIMSFESGHSFSPKKKSPVSGATLQHCQARHTRASESQGWPHY